MMALRAYPKNGSRRGNEADLLAHRTTVRLVTSAATFRSSRIGTFSAQKSQRNLLSSRPVFLINRKGTGRVRGVNRFYSINAQLDQVKN